MKYACFISHCGSEEDLGRSAVGQLYKALCGEIEMELGSREEVYIDDQRLEPGYCFNESLARAICESACLVVIFWPAYFGRGHLYCAREFMAMEQLESKRLAAIGNSERGLIVPIVIRRTDLLPAIIKNQRQYADFCAFSLHGEAMERHPDFAPKVQEIARYVADRFRELRGHGDECLDFQLPTAIEAETWLDTVASPAVTGTLLNR